MWHRGLQKERRDLQDVSLVRMWCLVACLRGSVRYQLWVCVCAAADACVWQPGAPGASALFADALHHAARDGEHALVTQLLDSKVVDINHKGGVRPQLHPPAPPPLCEEALIWKRVL
jgi:hypothetical protein